MSNAALAADRSEARTASDRPEPMNTRHGKKQDRKFGTIIAPYLFVLPAFVIVFVFIVLAALNTFRLAFTDSTLLRPGKFVGFENFIKLFHDEYFLTALLNSTIYVICVVPFMVILPLILAYLVKGNSRIMGFFRTAFYMPVVMSAVVVGMIWTNLAGFRRSGQLRAQGIEDHLQADSIPHRSMGRALQLDVRDNLAGPRLLHGHLPDRPRQHR